MVSSQSGIYIYIYIHVIKGASISIFSVASTLLNTLNLVMSHGLISEMIA